MINMIFLIPLIVESASYECYISPYAGIFYPRDTILQNYFDRNSVNIYGVGSEIISKKYNIGLSVKLQRFSFCVLDPHAVGGFEPVSGTWFTMGIEKNFPVAFARFYGRIGGTLHYHSYDIFISSFRYGFQPSLGVKINATKHIMPFFEIDYEYEKLTIDYYYNFFYTRHQVYLAGKDFYAGGILLNAGIFFNLVN